MPKFELSFTVRPGQDFDPELMARVAAPYFRKGDTAATQFGVHTIPVFHFDGQLQYTNWGLELSDVDFDAALELARKLDVLFPEVQIQAPVEDRPANADWYGMYSSRGAEVCATLLNTTFDFMGFNNGNTALRDALKWFVAERERLGREFGLAELNDTAVREALWARLEQGARERMYLDEDFERAYQEVA